MRGQLYHGHYLIISPLHGHGEVANENPLILPCTLSIVGALVLLKRRAGKKMRAPLLGLPKSINYRSFLGLNFLKKYPFESKRKGLRRKYHLTNYNPILFLLSQTETNVKKCQIHVSTAPNVSTPKEATFVVVLLDGLLTGKHAKVCGNFKTTALLTKSNVSFGLPLHL